MALLEPDEAKGGLTQVDIEVLLTDEWVARWDLVCFCVAL